PAVGKLTHDIVCPAAQHSLRDAGRNPYLLPVVDGRDWRVQRAQGVQRGQRSARSTLAGHGVAGIAGSPPHGGSRRLRRPHAAGSHTHFSGAYGGRGVAGPLSPLSSAVLALL